MEKTSTSAQNAAPRFRAWHALLIGAGVTVLQLGLAVGVQRGETLRGAYANLFQWDSEHYDRIAKDGYFANLPTFGEGTELTPASWIKNTNVAFFPGYPFAARLLRPWMFRKFALLLTAELAAAGMWTTLALLLRRLGVRPGIAALTIAFAAAQPAAFYLVAAYSESLFLWGLLGMLAWTLARGNGSWILAGLHGFLMSVTRIFGLGVAALPLVGALLEHRRNPSTPEAKAAIRRGAGASLLAAAGTLVFFAYCQIAFGLWNLYFLRQSAGWNIHPHYLLWDAHAVGLVLPDWPADLADGQAMSRLSASVAFWFLALGFGLDAWTSSRDRDPAFATRALLWLGAFALFYLPGAALIGNDWQSMLRYVFPTVLLGSVALAQRWSTARLSRRANAAIGAAVLLVTVLLLAEQVVLIRAFAAGKWVA